MLASARFADPCRTQPGPRRRVHVLGADDRPRRHPRPRLRAGARRHPVTESVGPLRAARGDRDLARGVPVRAGGLRAPSARREHRLGIRADRRRAGGADARGARTPRDRRAGDDDDVVPRASARARTGSRTASCRSTRSRTRSRRGGPRQGCSSTRASSRSRTTASSRCSTSGSGGFSRPVFLSHSG